MCGGTSLQTVLDLGVQALTGVFPRAGEPSPPAGPLQLTKCVATDGCGLVQLKHSFDGAEMYGLNYGYRSGLNPSMAGHLEGIVKDLYRRLTIRPDDVALDIGSNDGTLLSFHDRSVTRVGIDPTASKFREMYAEGDLVVADFFSAASFRQVVGSQARLITSIAMIYDLERPRQFVEDIREVLAPDGLWCFEQSYLPSMLRTNAYDTVCHEHLEYYGAQQIQWLLERSGLKIVDVEKNLANGGSLRVIAAHIDSAYEPSVSVERLLNAEQREEAGSLRSLAEFAARVASHRDALNSLLAATIQSGRSIFGYGASTKGNVILQYCGIGPETIPFIAEVNDDKFGRVTPGTGIAIISEAEARERRPDVFLVLPWHFREFICKKERLFLSQGGQLMFPLPEIEFVSA